MPRARLSLTAPSLLQRIMPLVACMLLLSVGRASRLDAQDTTKTAPPVPAPAATPAPAPQDSTRPAVQDTTKHPAPLDSVKKVAAVAIPASGPAATADSSAKTAPATASTGPSVVPAGAPAAAPAAAPATVPGDSTKALTSPAVTPPAATAPAATTAPAPAAAAPSTASAAINVPMPVVTAPPPVDTLPDANAHVQAASRMLEQGKVGAAVGELLQGVREDPTDIDTWVSLGDIYRQTGKTKLALETYAKALNVVSGAANELRVPYAELLYRSKKKEQAIEVLKKGIELDPDVSSDLKSLLGRIIIDDMSVGESTDAVASDAPEPSKTEKVAAAPKAKSATPKISVKKKKRLCKLFCPEDLKVPKK